MLISLMTIHSIFKRVSVLLIPCVACAPVPKKNRGLGPVGLELQTIVSCLIGVLGAKLEVLCKSSYRVLLTADPSLQPQTIHSFLLKNNGDYLSQILK